MVMQFIHGGDLDVDLDSILMRSQLSSGVVEIPQPRAFAALKSDGSVVTWGS